MWPSAVVLAQWLVRDPSLVCGCGATSVLELGAGCGLTGIVAALLQQQRSTTTKPCRIFLTDFNSAVLENLQHNLVLNDVTDVCSVAGLDFHLQSGTTDCWKCVDGIKRVPVNVVLAADIICQPSDAVAAANTLHDVLQPGGVAYVVCADALHRFGVDHFAAECKRVGLTVTTRDARDVYDDNMPPRTVYPANNLEQTAGYVPGMTFILFTVRKKISIDVSPPAY